MYVIHTYVHKYMSTYTRYYIHCIQTHIHTHTNTADDNLYINVSLHDINPRSIQPSGVQGGCFVDYHYKFAKGKYE